MTTYSIVYLITEVFYAYILTIFFDFFFGKRRTDTQVVAATYLVFIAIADGAYFIFNNAPLNTAILITSLFLLSYHYEASLKKRILTALLFYIMLVVIETLVVLLTSTLEVSPIQKASYNEIIGPILYKIALYVIALLLKNIKKVRQDAAVPTTLWISIVLIPTGSVYLIISAMDILYSNRVRLAISIIVILLINIVTFYLYDAVSMLYNEKTKIKLLQQENRYYTKQFENISTHIDEVRAFRHDFKNHLEVLYSLMDKDAKEARDYIAGITGVMTSGNQYSKSGNITVDSIVNYKLTRAKENDMEIDTDISVPEVLKVDSSDLVVILGNLLDNALNASLKLEKGRRIEVSMKYNMGMLQITVANAFDGILQYEEGKLKTTAVHNKRNHGYGLRNVEQALRKYDGQCEISNSDTIFRVKVIMFT